MPDKIPSKLSSNLSCNNLGQDLYCNNKMVKSSNTMTYVDNIQTKAPINTWHNENVHNSKLYSEELTSNKSLYQFEKEKSFEKNDISEKSESKMYSSFGQNEISDKSENKMYNSFDENVNDSIFTEFPVESTNKKRRLNDENYLVPVIFGEVLRRNSASRRSNKKNRKVDEKFAEVKILLDSGASATLVNKSKIPGNVKKAEATKWDTMAGTFQTDSVANLKFSLSELNPTASIRTDVYAVDDMQNYDMIIGRDLLNQLGFVINFREKIIQWEDAEIPMKDPNSTRKTHFYVDEPSSVQEESDRLKKVLDAKYAPANLETILIDNQHLKIEKRQNCINY